MPALLWRVLNNRNAQVRWNCNTASYWSSTEYDLGNKWAMMMAMSTGWETYNGKENLHSVREVALSNGLLILFLKCLLPGTLAKQSLAVAF